MHQVMINCRTYLGDPQFCRQWSPNEMRLLPKKQSMPMQLTSTCLCFEEFKANNSPHTVVAVWISMPDYQPFITKLYILIWVGNKLLHNFIEFFGLFMAFFKRSVVISHSLYCMEGLWNIFLNVQTTLYCFWNSKIYLEMIRCHLPLFIQLS